LATTIEPMTAKEKVLEQAPSWSEEQATAALEAVEAEPGPNEEWGEPEMAPLPESWGRMANGQPMPNVVAAVQRSRAGH
jgi:hypothetical protein